MARTSRDPATRTDAAFVYPSPTRRGVAAGAVATGLAAVLLGAQTPDGRGWYVAALALSAAPFATTGLALSAHVAGCAPTPYRPFWRRWLAAAATAYAGGAAGLVGAITGWSAAYGVAAALLVAAVPLWFVAGVHMQRAQAGRRAVSVDVLDAVTALVVLGAPAVLVLAGPLAAAEHPLFALPFVASVVLVPGGTYLSMRNLRLIPRGERVTQAIAIALGAAFALNLTVQIAHVLSDFALPMWLLIACQVLNMGLLMAVPLWAHRREASVLAGLSPERQVRGSDPLPVISAVLLPALGVVAVAGRAQRPWGVPFVIAVLAAVIVLGATRNSLLRRETERLYDELAQIADDRRQLLARMLEVLDADRRRVAAELHTHAVSSFAALGAVIDGARLSLPPDAATAIGAALAQAQDDLRARAESLRRLRAVVEPADAEGRRRPDGPGPEGGGLATALTALGAELADARPRPRLSVRVDPELELDWAMTTIAHRIAQEAMVEAVAKRGATHVAVVVTGRAGAVVVEVVDDGAGQGSSQPPTPSATVALFAQLAGGSVTAEPSPDGGTTVRAVLAGTEPHAAPAPPSAAHRRHLLLVPGEAAPDGSASHLDG